jgi:hypothetical protein
MARFTQSGSGSGGSLPQDLSTTASPTFDKIFVTNNGSGTNVYIGDDVVLGDVNQSNTVSVIGIQDGTQGGIVLGNQLREKVYSDGSNLNLQGYSNINLNTSIGDIILNPDGNIYRYNNADSNNRIATIGDIPNIDLSTSPQYFAYGAFHDENTFGPYTANTEHSLSYETTDMSHDVHIGGINNDQIVMDKAGKYNIAFSIQLHSSPGSAIVYIWLAKNGTALPWTNTRYDITANNPYAVAAWNFFVDAAANDYYEIKWSATTNNVKIEAMTGLTGTKPNVPSVIATVNQVG